MTMNHLKRLAVPRTWQLERKKNRYITRAYPGAHPSQHAMALSVVMRNLIKCVKTRKEVKYALANTEILIDGSRVKDDKMPVGLMDVITLTQSKESFRIVLDAFGHLKAIAVRPEESKTKPSRIVGKTVLAGKTIQLNMADGRNILVDKDGYKVADTLVLEVPSQKIIERLPFEKGMLIYLLGGKHIGAVGELEDVAGTKISVKTAKGSFETLKEYAFVIGRKKPCITLESK